MALRLIQQSGLTNLQIIDKPVEGFAQDFCFAVQEGDRETLALLNEGLAIVKVDGTYSHLHAKWFTALELPSDRPLIIGGDHNYPPFEYLNKRGVPSGYCVELTRAIAAEMGLNIEIRLGPWTEIVRDLEEGRIDAIQGMFYLPGRDLKFDFTQPHAVHHYVAVVREGEDAPPATIDELAGKRVVLQRGDAIHDFLVENGFGDQLTLVETQEDVLRELAEGKHDCALAVRISSLYLIEKQGWTHLRLGRRPFVSMQYCYAVLNDQKALLAEFNEGLNVLEANGEYRRIYEKWLGVYEKEPPSLLTALRYSAMILVPLLLILIATFLWSWSLRRQVAARTRELRESLDRFQYIFESANVGKSITLLTGEINVNKAFAEYLGYAPEELKNTTWQEITPPEDVGPIQEQIIPLLDGHRDSARFEKRYIRKDGSFVWGDVSVTIRRDAEGNPLYFVTTVVDITDHKCAEERERHLTDVLRAVRDVNQLITHEREPDALLRAACEILTETRGYRSAWIGLGSSDDQMKVVAESGIGEGLAALREGFERGDWPKCCQLAMETSGSIVMHNTSKNCVECPLGQNYRDTAALASALRYGEREYGVLVVALPADVADDDQEKSLFQELAEDIGFALYGIEMEQERWKAVEALRESERFARSTIDALSSNLCVLDEDGNILSVNQAWRNFAQTNGANPADVCENANYFKVCGAAFGEEKGFAAQFAEGVREVLSGSREELAMEYPCHSPTEQRWFIAHVTRFAGDGAVRAVVEHESITMRRRAEEALAASAKRYQLLADNTLDVIWTMNLELEFTYVNPAITELTGYTPEEWIGTHLPDHCEESRFQEMATLIQEEIAKEPPHRGVVFETEMLRHDGSPIPVEIHGKVIFNADGAPVMLQGVTRDITDRKRGEEERERLQTQLIQAQKMESVGRLAGGVAHDFNNILQAMLGYSSMLLDELPEDSEVHAFAEQIAFGVDRASALTRQLLAFARKQTIKPKVLNLNDTVESMLKMLRRLIGEDIDLAWLPEAGLWPVKMDPGQIDQILANLCVNARDAISGVGKVTIETKNVVFDEAHCAEHVGFVPGGFVLLAVSDDGCGMDKETSENIFEPFFTTKGLHEGTGLGLATVYGIVKQNEGFINVYSEPGKGTTFKIYLPRHRGEVVPEKAISKAEIQTGHGETILVVEDDASLLNLGKRLLENLGYNVLAASTPGEATEFARERGGDIHLLISDVVMPEMNGRDLAEQLRSLCPHITVLFMSGYTANVIAHRGVLDEDVNFLQKPFSMEDLAAKVYEALNINK